jgi:hypothetical protein
VKEAGGPAPTTAVYEVQVIDLAGKTLITAAGGTWPHSYVRTVL